MNIFDENYDYALSMLSDWVKESMESPNTPNQVYETIVRTVREKRDYHQSCYKNSVKLLELLKGGMTPMPEQSVTSYGGTDSSPGSKELGGFLALSEKTGGWESNYTKEEEREIEMKEREYERKRAIRDAQDKNEVEQIRKEGGYDWTQELDMALSQSVEESLKEAEQSLRNALAYAARQERPMVCSVIADLISIESMQETTPFWTNLRIANQEILACLTTCLTSNPKKTLKFLN